MQDIKTVMHIKFYINAISHAVSHSWTEKKKAGGQLDIYSMLFICTMIEH